jgi:hypothetical protein
LAQSERKETGEDARSTFWSSERSLQLDYRGRLAELTGLEPVVPTEENSIRVVLGLIRANGELSRLRASYPVFFGIRKNSKPSCFVIQPFDGGNFYERYEDVFAPAIKDAELEPYRVDKNPSVSIPIDSIEKQIREKGSENRGILPSSHSFET